MTSIGGFDKYGGLGALSQLNAANVSGTGINSLTGQPLSSALPSATISALGVSLGAGSAAATIQQLARNQTIQTQKNNIYKAISDRITAISKGQLTPSADWEKLAGYYSGIGKPFVVSLDNKGQPVITSQDQMDASRYSTAQRGKLANAVTSLLKLAPQIQDNVDHDKLKNQWDSISVNLVDIKNNRMVPTNDWQQQAVPILALNHPISFSLDAKGNVSVEDQTTSMFQDQDPSVRSTLIKASRIAADAVSTDMAYNAYTAQGQSVPQAVQDKEALYSQYSWVSEASSYAAMGVPYTLGVDQSQIDTSVNYVSKTEKTVFSNSPTPSVNSYTVQNNGMDNFGYPDTTTDASSPRPYAANSAITTTIAGFTDGAGNAITPYQYTNPVNISSTANNTLAVTDTVTGNTDTFSYDGAGTTTVTTTNKLGVQTATNSYGNTTGLSAVATEPATHRLVDGAGKSILAPGSGLPITYNFPATVNRASDGLSMTVTNTANGNVDSYAFQLDASSNPITDTNGNYLITATHTDSLGRTIAAAQTLGASTGTLNDVATTPNSKTILADGANATAQITDGSGGTLTDTLGNAAPTYGTSISIKDGGYGNFSITDTTTGNVDQYAYDLKNQALTITHKDSANNTVAATQSFTSVSGIGKFWTPISNQTILPVDKFTSAAGSNGNKLASIVTDGSGNALATYTDPVSIANDGAGTITVTHQQSKTVDKFVDNGDNTISLSHLDSAGDTLSAGSTMTGVGLNAIVAQTPTISFTDGSGSAILDSSGNAIPTYTNPVTFTNNGATSPDKGYTVTDNVTGNYDQFNFDSASSTLTVRHNDNQGNLLYTQTATGVSDLVPASSPVSITDGSGGTLTDTLGSNAPTYTTPVSIKDAGGGNFSITDSLTNYVDHYAYDSVGQTLTITHSDNANNTLSTQSFTGVTGITQPWASQQATTPTTVSITPQTAAVTDASGGALTDTLGVAAPTYVNPVTISDAGGGSFSITDNATGYVDQYAYDSTAQTLSITHKDNTNTTLSTQDFTGVTGIAQPWAAQQAASPTAWAVAPTSFGVTDSTGGTLTDTLGAAAPTYTNPVTVADAGAGNFTVTDNNTGYVDLYAYDSTSQTLSITRNDNASNTLSTQSFTGVTGLTAPWASQQTASPTSWSVASTPSSVTDASGGTLTDTLGTDAPTYSNPITVSDSGAGNFSITDTVTGYVDNYVYDSANQTMGITLTDGAGTTLSTQSFTGVTGIGVPWASQQAASPTSWTVAPTAIGVTDASGGALTDTLGAAAPTYTSPISVSDAGAGTFSVTDSSNGYVDLYAYDSAAQTLSITRNDNASNTLSTQSFTGVTGLTVPWASQQAASPTSWSMALTPPVSVTDSLGAALTDTLGAAAPTYANPVSIRDSGSGKFSITDTTTGNVDYYAYDSAGQNLTITSKDSLDNTLGSQSFTGVNGLSHPWTSPTAGAATWDVFNKTTNNTTLTSDSSYNTSYDTSTFDITNPSAHVNTAAAYTSSTTFSYTSNNVLNPTLMQSALPDLKLNYVVSPKITVTAVTDLPMPTTLASSTEPHTFNTNTMEQWQKDAMNFMKAGTPFMLDFNQQGGLVAKPLTGDSIIRFNNPQAGMGSYSGGGQASQTYAYSGVPSLLSTIA